MIAIEHDDLMRSLGISESAYAQARETLACIMPDNVDEFVSFFYTTLLEDADASTFLSSSVVQNQLSRSLREWLLELLSADLVSNTEQFHQRQTMIGKVHARIKVPIHLVMEGASLLKRAVAGKLMKLDLDGQQMAAVLVLLNELVDGAMQIMSAAYVRGTSKRARTDEAYRLFSLGRDIGIERESQRAALMEWSHSIFINLLGKTKNAPLSPISGSSFGLWFHHHGSVMFEDDSALEKIETAMERVDRILLPSMEKANRDGLPTLPELLDEFQAIIEKIKFLVSDLFKSAEAVENGRDPLTRALNRRFLPSILNREIHLANMHGLTFALLLFDVDHFKKINDDFGHAAGDTVLCRIAAIIMENVRTDDFVFRYGGEEFLVALVETGEEEALRVAERIRAQIAARKLELPKDAAANATTSVGIAVFDGHPDHLHLINAADQAMYQAKKLGRNRIEVARTLNFSVL
ncbi:MAG: diguanylate cyclase [Phyllobacterium sp.]